MRYSIYILTALYLLLLGCEKQTFEPAPFPVHEVDVPPSEVRYLALGDSYTIGTSVSYGGRFPKQLQRALQDRIPDTSFAEPHFVARSGWTSAQLLNALDGNDTLQPPYELVSLLIGVNNQYQNLPFSRYEQEFPELLSRAISLAGGDTSRVFVVSIPDYAFTPFGQNSGNPSEISSELEAYNAYNREIAESWGVDYFNITPISQNGLEQPSLVASDGLHPSGEQYGRWIDLMLPVLRAKF
jgi:lysophospholipase L1-like esterase